MPIDLYLVRHAEAILRGSLEPDDHRWLTERGRRRFVRAARRFARRVGRSRIDAILTSPLPRAVMTAEILARALRLDGPVEVCAQLAPDGGLWPAVALLTRQERVVAAVGHEPQLTLLVRELCGAAADEALPEGRLRKGAIASLRLGDGEPGPQQARLRRLYNP